MEKTALRPAALALALFALAFAWGAFLGAHQAQAKTVSKSGWYRCDPGVYRDVYKLKITKKKLTTWGTVRYYKHGLNASSAVLEDAKRAFKFTKKTKFYGSASPESSKAWVRKSYSWFAKELRTAVKENFALYFQVKVKGGKVVKARFSAT